MAKKTNIKGKFKKIANSMAKLYRLEVIRQNLIDTGLMRDSFEVRIMIGKRGELDIQVMAVPYFPFIDNSPHHFKVSNNVFKSLAYRKLESKMIDKGTEKFYKGGQFMPNGRRAPKGGIIAGRLNVVSKHF